MKNSNKIITLLLTLSSLFFALPAKAVCPVCTVAVFAGLGLSRWLGIDDTISGLWIGAITVSISMWTINWMNKKKWHFKGRKILIALVWYALIVLPLFFTNIMGHPLNKIWGIDKLFLGIVVGSITFFAMELWYEQLKKKNNGHAHFPFQKIAMPVGALIILSLIFYFITK